MKFIIPVLIGAGADVNARNELGATPLHLVAKRQRIPYYYAQFLIDAGADVNARLYDGKTPLHVAAEFGSASVMEALIDAGADVNARDDEGKTPFEYAYPVAHKVHMLTNAGADCRLDEQNRIYCPE